MNLNPFFQAINFIAESVYEKSKLQELGSSIRESVLGTFNGGNSLTQAMQPAANEYYGTGNVGGPVGPKSFFGNIASSIGSQINQGLANRLVTQGDESNFGNSYYSQPDMSQFSGMLTPPSVRTDPLASVTSRGGSGINFSNIGRALSSAYDFGTRPLGTEEGTPSPWDAIANSGRSGIMNAAEAFGFNPRNADVNRLPGDIGPVISATLSPATLLPATRGAQAGMVLRTMLPSGIGRVAAGLVEPIAMRGGIGKRLATEAAFNAASYYGGKVGAATGIPGADVVGSIVGGGGVAGLASRGVRGTDNVLAARSTKFDRTIENTSLPELSAMIGVKGDALTAIRDLDVRVRAQRATQAEVDQHTLLLDRAREAIQSSDELRGQFSKRRVGPLRQVLERSLDDEQGSVDPLAFARAAAPHVAPTIAGAATGAVIGGYTGGDLESAIEGAGYGAAAGGGLSIASKGAKYYVDEILPRNEFFKTNPDILPQTVERLEAQKKQIVDFLYAQPEFREAITGSRVGRVSWEDLQTIPVRSRAANRMRERLGAIDENLATITDPNTTPSELYHLLNTSFRQGEAAARIVEAGEPQGISKIIWNDIIDVANLPRTLITAFDASALFRQGAMLVGRPKEFLGAIKPMIKAMASENYERQFASDLASRPTASLHSRAKLALTEYAGQDLTKSEEGFLSRLGLKVPFVAGSARGYNTFLNKLRADTFDNIVKGWDEADLTDENLIALGNWINAATGRGRLPAVLEPHAAALNAVFFSPKFVASRIDAPYQMGQAVYGAATGRGPINPLVGKEIARDTIAFVGTGTMILSLGAAAGIWEVELDPRSADFGKGKIGNQRLDFWAGYGPLARVIAQSLSGEKKLTSTGDIVGVDRVEVLSRFLQSKLSPSAGLVADLKTGSTFLGDEITGDARTAREQIFNRMVPLFIQDITEAADAEGMWASIRASLSGVGVGTQTYSRDKTPFDETVSKDDPDYLIKKRDYYQANPGDLPQSRNKEVKATQAIREEVAGKLKLNTDATISNEQSLSKHRENRKELKAEQRNKLAASYKDFGDGNTKQEKWLDSYFALFSKPGVIDPKSSDIVSEVFDKAEAEWLSQPGNGTEAMDFINRYTASGNSAVDRAYVEDMQKLNAAGYWDMTKYKGLISGLDTDTLEYLNSRVTSARRAGNLPESFAASANIVLSGMGYNKDVIRDVINIGKDSHLSDEYKSLKSTLGKELLWFSSDSYWADYTTYTPKRARTGTRSRSQSDGNSGSPLNRSLSSRLNSDRGNSPLTRRLR